MDFHEAVCRIIEMFEKYNKPIKNPVSALPGGGTDRYLTGQTLWYFALKLAVRTNADYWCVTSAGRCSTVNTVFHSDKYCSFYDVSALGTSTTCTCRIHPPPL